MKHSRFVAIFVILVLTTSSAVAGPFGHGPMPLRGIGLMFAVPDSGVIDCLAHDGSVVTQFPQQLGAFARYTVTGRTDGTIVAEDCVFDPADGSLTVTGPVTQVGESGDELYAEFVTVFNADFSFDLDIEITGGSGSLAGACGFGRGGGDFNPAIGMGFTRLLAWMRVPRPNRPCRFAAAND